MKLPVVVDPATHACSTCPSPCCIEHEVEVNGFDLVRLTRGLALPWDAIVQDVIEPHGLFSGFRLDAGPQHHHFRLRRRPSGACQFLLEIGEFRRCGVHALRPGACRVYPLRASDGGSIVGAHAICPPAQRELYDQARPSLQSLVDEDEADEARWFRAVRRWDERRARVAHQPLPMAEFISWIETLVDGSEKV